MKWIVITSPDFFEGEAAFIQRILRAGADVVHLRKPSSDSGSCARLLDKLQPEERGRIMIHDFFELAKPYGLRGIHLNSRHGEVPQGYEGRVSRSCHSTEEVSRCKGMYDYVFLSPIFDSVSKKGYASAFTAKALLKAHAEGIIDEKVIALGGITPDKISAIKAFGFGGAAILGYVSNLADKPESIQDEELARIRRQSDS